MVGFSHRQRLIVYSAVAGNFDGTFYAIDMLVKMLYVRLGGGCGIFGSTELSW
jgi:hypothetical protein